jgi:DNA-binding MarR family transcriptional regulator
MPDPADRRGVHVRLTSAGKSRVDAALEDLLAREREILSVLPVRQQRTLAALLRDMVAPFDNEP